MQGYRALTASSATKTDTPLERIPQNIVVIPRSVIDDQGATTVSEAALNVSNVQPVDTRMIGNVAQAPVKIRGFDAEMWIDGYPGNLFVAGDRDGLANVERIEVLKGPNALLYGGGAGSPVGGTINVISKLPTDKARYEVGGTFGSYQYWNPYFDINQPLNDSKTALFRITGEYGQSKSFIDVLTPSRYNVNPTLTLTNREDTKLTIQGFVSEQRQQAYPGLPVEGTLFGAYRVRRDLYFGDPNIPLSTSRLYGTTVTFDHEFNNVWSTNIRARWSQSDIRQLSQSPLNDATFTGGTPVFPPAFFDVNGVDVLDRQQEFSINPSVKAKFAVGPTTNTLLFGADYSRVKDSGYMNTDLLGLLGVTADLSSPNPIFPPFTTPDPSSPAFFQFFKFDNTYLTKAVYTQLQSTIYDRIHLLAGVRLNSIDTTYNEFATTPPGVFKTEGTKALPRTGIVFDLVKGFSLYASYGEGMRWTPFTAAFVAGPPETSQQREAGVKFNWGDMLTGTVAAFDIDRQNVPYTTAAFTGAFSSQKSRGFEADVIFQPTSNWSILGSFGHTDAFYVDGRLPRRRQVTSCPSCRRTPDARGSTTSSTVRGRDGASAPAFMQRRASMSIRSTAGPRQVTTRLMRRLPMKRRSSGPPSSSRTSPARNIIRRTPGLAVRSRPVRHVRSICRPRTSSIEVQHDHAPTICCRECDAGRHASKSSGIRPGSAWRRGSRKYDAFARHVGHARPLDRHGADRVPDLSGIHGARHGRPALHADQFDGATTHVVAKTRDDREERHRLDVSAQRFVRRLSGRAGHHLCSGGASGTLAAMQDDADDPLPQGSRQPGQVRHIGVHRLV